MSRGFRFASRSRSCQSWIDSRAPLGAGLAPGALSFSTSPFHPPESPSNAENWPFRGYRFRYRHVHGNMWRVYRAQTQLRTSAALSSLVLSSTLVVQPLKIQSLTHSFVQRLSRNPFLFYRFRTLSIATGGVHPYWAALIAWLVLFDFTFPRAGAQKCPCFGCAEDLHDGVIGSYGPGSVGRTPSRDSGWCSEVWR